ncbi:MAG: DNA cytosine methyltransferase [Ignavibacteria bacterium]|nr:DNA cytosine methyltransferase [Ignavibacteria bacterium]
MTKVETSIFSFFSGAGFLDLGFEYNDFKIDFVNEYQKSFLETYKSTRKNLNKDIPLFGYSGEDVSKFLENKNLQFLKEIIRESKTSNKLIGFVGGPPCPDFSIAGKNRGKEGENGKLTEVYFELIKLLNPDFFLFENVKGLFKTEKHRKFYDEMKMKVASNYILNENLVNSLEYGVPQDRERIFLIGFKKNTFNSTRKLKENFDWELSKLYDINNIEKIKWPETSIFQNPLSEIQPDDIIKDLTVKFWFDKNKVDDHPNSLDSFKPKAGLSKFLIIPEGDVKKKSYKRLHRWRYSPTVAYGNNEVHLHPYLPRRISVAEALSLQTLPENFYFPEDITLSDKFKMIGNGVPFKLSSALASSVKKFISDNL